jgi:hypothetical protein
MKVLAPRPRRNGAAGAGPERRRGSVIMAIGNYPGAARPPDQPRAGADMAFSLIPGKLRFNLHAIYAETQAKVVERDQLRPLHFAKCMAWAKARGICLDFNPTFFAHLIANDGDTISHADESIRSFWVRHAIACRRIAEAMDRNQGASASSTAGSPTGPRTSPSTAGSRGAAWRSPSTKCSPPRSAAPTARTRSRASSSSSGARTTWWAAMSSTSAKP